jgi:hypothetical protein
VAGTAGLAAGPLGTAGLAAGRLGTAGFTAGWLGTAGGVTGRTGTAGLAVGALGCAGLDVEVDVPVAGVALDCPCHRPRASTTRTAATAVPMTTAQIRNQDVLVGGWLAGGWLVT